MSHDPAQQPDIPEDPPEDLRGGTTETPDAPLGVPADADPDDDAQPGLPEREPPASG